MSAPGYQILRQRLLRADSSTDGSSLRFVAKLIPSSAQLLAPVRVAASRRQRPSVRDGGPEIGGVELESVVSLSPSERGDLASLAASVPGVTLVQGQDGSVSGFSVLGLQSSDNIVRLNGLTSSSTQIPTSARVSTRLQTTTFDAAVGGFSGAALSVVASPGSNFVSGGMDISVDSPRLQSTDVTGRNLGREYQNVQISGYRSGALVRDKLLFNASVQGGRKANALISVSTATPDVLARVGVSEATTAQFLRTLDAVHVPAFSLSNTQAITDNASALVRVDILPTSTRALNAVMSANWRQSTPLQAGPAVTTSQGGALSATTLGTQLEYARFIDEFYLARVRSGLSLSRTRASALDALPTGAVLISSVLPDGQAALTTLGFGGPPTLPRSEDSWTWQNTLEMSWFSPDNRHRPKVTGGVELASTSRDPGANRLGTFTFNSLDDLAALRPASFTRALNVVRWDSREVDGWLSAGDVWRITDRFALQFGVRAEANEYGSAPTRNGLLDSLLNVRTDRVPNTATVLPRAGFTWSYGSESRISLFGAQPKGTIRGGIGEFRSLLGVSLPGEALGADGSLSAAQQLTCVGPAVPQPDWAAYAQSVSAIPSQCLQVTGSSFGNAQPSVVAFSPDYQPSRALRANLGWSGALLAAVRLQADALYSLNRNQPGTIDRNLVDAPRFFLPQEGSRPVYVDVAQIDPVSGAPSLSASRRSAQFARVTQLTSDGQSESKQMVLSISPTSGLFVSHYWTLGYAYTQIRDRARGFDGGAFGDPRQMSGWETATGDVRHSATGTFAWLFGDATWFRLTAQLHSGVPFTPRVQGDVNGDGADDDRAFVFDPARTSDAAVAHDMQQLLTSATGSVRQCLATQLGMPAARNSCRGPWTTALTMQVAFDGPTVGLSRRATFLLTATNPLAGLDVALHGSERIHGWGQPAIPNPVLLVVKGFDPATTRFRYAVNPTFGDPSPSHSVFRSPFTLTLSASISLGDAFPRQFVEDLLAPGRSRQGERLTAAQIAARYSQSGFFDPIQPILSARDSLLLCPGQFTAITALRAQYAAKADSIWLLLSNHLAALDTSFDRGEVLDRVHEARARAYGLLADAARQLRALLTPDQIALLAPELQQLLDERAIDRLRRNDARSY